MCRKSWAKFSLERAIVLALFFVSLSITILRPSHSPKRGVDSLQPFSAKLRKDFSKPQDAPVVDYEEVPWKSVNRDTTIENSATSSGIFIKSKRQKNRQGTTQQQLKTLQPHQLQQAQQAQQVQQPQQPQLVPQPIVTNRKLRAFLFTMDSLSGFSENAKRGGAAGELIVREALQWALSELGVELIVADSDASMEEKTRDGLARTYDMFFFDPWTITDRNMQLRSYLLGREKSVFILSFFGWKPSTFGFSIPESNVLTAYPNTPGGAFSFLGFIINPINDIEIKTKTLNKTKRSGVIWGKKPAYFEGREEMLDALSRDESLKLDELHFIGVENGKRPASGKSAVYHGHLDRTQWHLILLESSFLLGLGNPLLGPSALEAVAAGAMYLDPMYDGKRTKPLTDVSPLFTSQHPFLKAVGEPYVCSISDVTNYDSVRPCVEKALSTSLDPFIEPLFTRTEYINRVRKIVDLFALQLTN
jgi:hypothetical protein